MGRILAETIKMGRMELRERYPEIEPYEEGWLDVGDGNRVFWEASGNPEGKPAVVLHGGPGAGSSPGMRRYFDPAAYRIVQFDQRGCGRSTPHASAPDTDLAANTTQHLIADIELLRERLGVESWLVFGASWGSTLALAYAQAHPGRVSAILLWAVTTGRHSEMDWMFRGGVSERFFPQQWDELRAGVPEELRGGDVVEAYARLLEDPDPSVRERAAIAWCTWESATPDWPPTTGLADHFRDTTYALAFARLVTHYIRHNAFLEDGRLIRDAHLLADIPGVLVHGRFDLGSPMGNAWALKRAWPRADLRIVDDTGHSATPALRHEVIMATDRLADDPPRSTKTLRG
jgi:proline iminopeptidase